VTRPDRQTLIELYVHRGLSQSQIAEAYGVDRWAVRIWLKESDLRCRRPGGVFRAEAEQLIAFVDAGNDEYQVAEHFGYSRVTKARRAVKSAFNDAGRTWVPEWQTPRECKACGRVFVPKRRSQNEYCSSPECKETRKTRTKLRNYAKASDRSDGVGAWEAWPAVASRMATNDRGNNSWPAWELRFERMRTSLDVRAGMPEPKPQVNPTLTWDEWSRVGAVSVRVLNHQSALHEWEKRIVGMAKTIVKNMKSASRSRGRFFHE